MRWMKAKKRILVLLHENERTQKFKKMMIAQMFPHWRRQGYKVIVQKGTQRITPADLLVAHVDLSVIPESYRRFFQHYPCVVNGRVTDIRKATYSENILNRGTDFSGMVIAKSNYNYNGKPEQQLLNDSGYASPFQDYPVFKNVAEVPDLYWDHPNVIIERFLPETDGKAYYLRQYAFLGDQEVWLRMGSHSPVVAASKAFVYQNIEPDPTVRTFRERLGFDYGKFDYVIHEGKPVLLDANKTQGGGVSTHFKEYGDTTRQRALGISSFL